MFPKTTSEAIDQINQHILDNLMPPPHYKYRLSALASDKLKSLQFNEGQQGWPTIRIYYSPESAAGHLEKGESAKTYPNSGLTYIWNNGELAKFILTVNEQEEYFHNLEC
jgi:hypothetical protein